MNGGHYWTVKFYRSCDEPNPSRICFVAVTSEQKAFDAAQKHMKADEAMFELAKAHLRNAPSDEKLLK